MLIVEGRDGVRRGELPDGRVIPQSDVIPTVTVKVFGANWHKLPLSESEEPEMASRMRGTASFWVDCSSRIQARSLNLEVEQSTRQHERPLATVFLK